MLSLVASSALSLRTVQPAIGGARLGVRARALPLMQETDTKPAPFSFFQQNVPEDQQPVVELQNLRKQAFYDWADDDNYGSKLRNLWIGIMFFFSLPISYTTYDQLPYELPQLFLSANLGTLAAMLPFIVRLRVGWGFVSKRLRAKASYYEAEQRGLLARKDRETQTRDRLIEKTEVAPNLRRVDASIAATIAALFVTLASAEAITVLEGENGPSTLKTLSGDAAIDYTNRLRGDDAFAAREQARAQRKADENGEGVKPAYCDSRYYKILAGGNSQGGVGCGD